MKKTKQILAWLLIFSAVCIADLPRTSQELTTMLQEAQYQEQTVGNLDRAIELYRQVLTEAAEVDRLAARAAFQLAVCFQKQGDDTKAADYFRKVINRYPSQKALSQRAQEQLAAMIPDEEYGVFGQLPDNVLTVLYTQYNLIRAEANSKNLYHNSHIYYVDSNFMLYRGGGGYFMNRENTPVSDRVILSSTSYPDMRHYDLGSRRMQTELLPSGRRDGHYNIYWTPSEPIPPRQIFLYVWSLHDPAELPASGRRRDTFALNMQNDPGSRIQETFFLVLADSLELADADKSFTGKDLVDGYKIYYWSDEVPENTTNSVTASLTKVESPRTESVYVIHYKAIDQSQNALELLNNIHPRGVRTFRANRYRDGGKTINSICTDSEESKTKLVEVINSSSDLTLIKVESPPTNEQLSQDGYFGRITVKNTGAGIIEVKADNNEEQVLLGPNGTGYFDQNSAIQIGDAIIRVGYRINVINTGSDMIRITYHDVAGDEQEIQIGMGGVGHIGKSTPFKIGDVNIRVLENDYSARLQSLFMACGTLCDSIRRAVIDNDFHTAQRLCLQVEKHLAEGLVLAHGHEIEPMLESLAEQFRVWHEVIKAEDKGKAISIGIALNESGGNMSEMIINALSGNNR